MLCANCDMRHTKVNNNYLHVLLRDNIISRLDIK